ncbi:MAG: FAD-dependent oxidoreductase [Vampirovibrionales bacterium]|nr:FAD-dependent oxidoreductase [Vampirovibrionales bacterium]
MSSKPVDILVVGDEIESCLAAVSAARALKALGCQGSVMLLAPPAFEETGLLGGLSTWGGLSYMDITLNEVSALYKSPLFDEFLQRAGVIRVALDAQRASNTLRAMLTEAGVEVATGNATAIEPQATGWEVLTQQGQAFHTTVMIDATPDADVARLAGCRFIQGLGGLLQQVSGNSAAPNTLGISPLFTLCGLTRQALIAFEEILRQHPDTPQLIAAGLPWLSQTEQAELLTRPVFSPEDEDYVDILNPIIGLHWHRWRGGTPESYPSASPKIDGFNTAWLNKGQSNEAFGFNGIVFHGDSTDEDIALSQGKHGMPSEMAQAVDSFCQFLREVGGLTVGSVSMATMPYVRQSVQVCTQAMVTGASLLQGGVDESEAIGTFSYWVDWRGANLKQYAPQLKSFPKPVFNVGLGSVFPTGDYNNLAVVGRSAGYGPVAQGACRIIQHNAMVGEALGIAAALAIHTQIYLTEVPITQIQAHQSKRYQAHYGQSLQPCGKAFWTAAECNAHPLLVAEQALINTL